MQNGYSAKHNVSG